MPSLGRRLWDALMLLAVLWTVYEELRHLGHYLHATPGAPVGIREGIDVLATLVLLGVALYELLHLSGATERFDRFIAAHPAVEMLTLLLLGALCWGAFRDAAHFRASLALGAEANAEDLLDEMAAAVLGLGALKLTYHGLFAVATLRNLARGVIALSLLRRLVSGLGRSRAR